MDPLTGISVVALLAPAVLSVVRTLIKIRVAQKASDSVQPDRAEEILDAFIQRNLRRGAE